MRLWMLSGGTVAAAAAMGLTLGSYAISPQRSPLEQQTDDDAFAPDIAAAPTSMPNPGPRTISCTGCGPTLAERRYAADMVGYDSYGMVDGDSSDAVVRGYMDQDYSAGDDGVQADMRTADDGRSLNAPVPTIHQLPPNIVRFADDPSPAQRRAMSPAQPTPGPALRMAAGDPAGTPAAGQQPAMAAAAHTYGSDF